MEHARKRRGGDTTGALTEAFEEYGELLLALVLENMTRQWRRGFGGATLWRRQGFMDEWYVRTGQHA